MEQAVDSACYTRLLSPANPATITVFPNSFATDPLQAKPRRFLEFQDLCEWFGRAPLEAADKKMVPLYARALCVGKRLKGNLRPPFLVILDVDGSRMAPRDCSARLEMFGVDHAWHTTWSHDGKGGLWRYRVITDLLAMTWWEVQDLTEQVFELAGIEKGARDPASWTSPWFYVPAVKVGA